ncbi:MAG: arylsulfatase [Waddliaceae bacterium]|nr:arylsulfatase [Waddliaceae bacterium]
MTLYRIFCRTVSSLGLTLFAAGVLSSSSLCAELEPAIDHPDQNLIAKAKLEALEERFGKKPNILIFVVDDMGYGDPGIYGGGAIVGAPTPNMDRIGHDGLMLTSCYSQPTCSPSRATLMTGRLPIRHGIYRPPMYGEPGGLEGEITAASILQDHGYRTQLVGKWHLGEREDQQPHNCGYDDFFGFLAVSNMYTEWRDKHFNPELYYDEDLTNLITRGWTQHLAHGVKGEALKEIKEIDIDVLAELDQEFAEYSENFIRKMADADEPFYLVHACSKVHFDSYPSEKFAGKSPAKHPYKDGIIEIDDVLGRLVKVLEETGQAENTLVFVTSDNGPQEEIWPDSGVTPFRFGKGTTCEGGVRVPGIVYWPGMIEAGRVSDGLFDFADLFTTSLALAGATEDIPEDRYIDGIDQTSFLLAGDAKESNRRAIYYWIMDDLSAVRIGSYKYYRKIFQVNDGYGGVMGGMEGSLATLPYGQLYNLHLDPKEMKPMLARKTWMAPILTPLIGQHFQTLVRFPPKSAIVTIN